MPQGRKYSQGEYKEYARRFQDAWLDGHPEMQVALAEAGDDTAARARVFEAEYWYALPAVCTAPAMSMARSTVCLVLVCPGAVPCWEGGVFLPIGA